MSMHDTHRKQTHDSINRKGDARHTRACFIYTCEQSVLIQTAVETIWRVFCSLRRHVWRFSGKMTE